MLVLQPSSAHALTPDEIALIANKNDPASLELAEFYANARLIPKDRILALDLTPGEEVTFDEYETKIVPAIRDSLRERGLQNKVRCLVTFYGTPLRIRGKTTTPAEREEVKQLKDELAEVRKRLPPVVAGLESLAAELNTSFKPEAGEALDEIGKRADAALRIIAMSLRTMPPGEQVSVLARLAKLVVDFTGPAKLAEMFTGQLPKGFDPPGDDPRWRRKVERNKERIEELQERRFDVDARKELRKLMDESFGPFSLAHAIQAQIDYLDNDGTSAAFDNELALLWWSYYPRSKWLANPLSYRMKNVRSQPVLMTMRLDAPNEQLVRELIVASLKAERDGLQGKIVIDSRGLMAKPPGDKDAGYAVYDQTLRNLSNLIRTHTKMGLTLDDRPEILGARTIDDVALYCGWYSLRRYVPASKLNGGAVAFHVASLEMVSLHNPNEGGWCAGLLRSGAAATLGPVAEPYLSAFPPADDFFPLLLTGKLTLAEVYWRTTPMTSWMINMIGDPLYTPYKVNPQMKVENLPPRLRDALEPMPRFSLPATRPATSPSARP